MVTNLSEGSAAIADGFLGPLQLHARQDSGSLQSFSVKTLKTSAGLWFVVAVIGQLIFALYITLFYGGAAVRGNFAAWNKGTPDGYVAGDTLGNVVVTIHLLVAVIIIVGGAIQLVPQIRKRVPRFHRWTGRVYIVTAFTISIAGLYMLWVRGTPGDLTTHLATTINAILIMLCAAMALRYALARKFAVHRRWALRLFLVSGGAWFFRVAFWLWLFINNGPVGFDMKTFSGPFLTIGYFGQFLLPLGVLELYLRARDRGHASVRIAMAAFLFLLTVAMGVGICVVTARRWLPKMY